MKRQTAKRKKKDESLQLLEFKLAQAGLFFINEILTTKTSFTFMEKPSIDKYDLDDLEKINTQEFRYRDFTIKGPYIRENGPLPFYECIIYDLNEKKKETEQDMKAQDSLKFAMRYIDFLH